MERIEFKKEGYDPQIDYIKGLCILFVVWTHCMHRGKLSIKQCNPFLHNVL